MISKSIKFTISIVSVLLATAFILFSIFSPGIIPELFIGRYVTLLNHQIILLSSALFVVLSTILLHGKDSLKILNFKNRDGEIVPVPKLGIKPKQGETWFKLGSQMLLSITIITTVVIYFQIAANHSIFFEPGMIIIIPLAASNALSEELIFRFSIVTAGDRLNMPHRVTEIVSGTIFGLAHYFGNPGGIPGVLMAGFIGWFLAKSMNETKGFFWAFIIHFTQDVVIFYAIILTLK